MSKPTYTDGDLLIADQDKLRDWEDGECEGIDIVRPAMPVEIIADVIEKAKLANGMLRTHNVRLAIQVPDLREGGGWLTYPITPEDLEEK